uniref:BTB domain-containing protein n=1 Tax=Glossina morsitans morsitans TaxID=37546 RepID=A0A1B0FQZ1_GLOMM
MLLLGVPKTAKRCGVRPLNQFTERTPIDARFQDYHVVLMLVNNADGVKPPFEERRKDEDYANNFLESLNRMRLRRKYLDFSLRIGGEIIHVHKCALAAVSPYFSDRFGTDLKGISSLTLENVELTSVQELIEYIYTGTVTITQNNVRELLRASNLFEIEWVKEKCEQFLERNANARISVRMCRFAG